MLLEFTSLVRRIRLFTYLLISLVVIDNLHCKEYKVADESFRKKFQKALLQMRLKTQ